MKQLYFLILLLGFSLPIMAMENGKVETNGHDIELQEIKIERVMPVGELMKSLGYTSKDAGFDQVMADLQETHIPLYNTLCNALTTSNTEAKKVVLHKLSKQKSSLGKLVNTRQLYAYLLLGENVLLVTGLAILALVYAANNNA